MAGCSLDRDTGRYVAIITDGGMSKGERNRIKIRVRSAMAAHAFRRAGYEAYSMLGGLEAWRANGLPLEGVVAPH